MTSSMNIDWVLNIERRSQSSRNSFKFKWLPRTVTNNLVNYISICIKNSYIRGRSEIFPDSSVMDKIEFSVVIKHFRMARKMTTETRRILLGVHSGSTSAFLASEWAHSNLVAQAEVTNYAVESQNCYKPWNGRQTSWYVNRSPIEA